MSKKKPNENILQTIKKSLNATLQDNKFQTIQRGLYKKIAENIMVLEKFCKYEIYPFK